MTARCPQKRAPNPMRNGKLQPGLTVSASGSSAGSCLRKLRNDWKYSNFRGCGGRRTRGRPDFGTRRITTGQTEILRFRPDTSARMATGSITGWRPSGRKKPSCPRHRFSGWTPLEWSGPRRSFGIAISNGQGSITAKTTLCPPLWQSARRRQTRAFIAG